MERVGVRELRQNLSVDLRGVRHGNRRLRKHFATFDALTLLTIVVASGNIEELVGGQMTSSVWIRRSVGGASAALLLTAITTADAARGRLHAEVPYWVAGGRLIAFYGFFDGDRDHERLWLMNADGSQRRWIRGSAGSSVASPSGRLVADSGDTGSAGVILIELSNGRVTRKFTIRVPDGEFYSPVVWAPNERSVAVEVCCGGGSREMVFVADLRTGLRLVSHVRSSDDRSPAWSPDSQRIAFVTCRQRGTTCGLATMRPDGRNRRLIVRGVARDVAAGIFSPEPAWAPNGREIAFARPFGQDRRISNEDFVRWAIYVVRSDGSKLRRIATTPFIDEAVSQLPIAWSPDSRHVAFIDMRGVSTADVSRRIASRLTRVRFENPAMFAVGVSWTPSKRILFSARGNVYALLLGRQPTRILP